MDGLPEHNHIGRGKGQRRVATPEQVHVWVGADVGKSMRAAQYEYPGDGSDSIVGTRGQR
jgi:hypothetical protein